MKNNDIWTPPRLVKWISQDFENRGFPPPHRLEAEYLVCHCLNISRLDIYLQHDKPCSIEERSHLKELLKRRQKREPLSYILGKFHFWTLELLVGPGVLIPRQDTEILVEAAINLISDQERTVHYHILELGTGTAAIPLSIAMERKQLHITTIEKNSPALKFANKNILKYQKEFLKNHNQVLLVQGDKFDAIQKYPFFDMIVSNPPYIPERDIDDLQAEVRSWEPKNALDGGKSGLDFYPYLKSQAELLLKPDGILIFEHGYQQKIQIMELFEQSSTLAIHQSIKDYANNDRVLAFKKL